MAPAKRFVFKRRFGRLVAVLDTALIGVWHSAKPHSLPKSVFSDTFVQDLRPTLPIVSSIDPNRFPVRYPRLRATLHRQAQSHINEAECPPERESMPEIDLRGWAG